MDITHTGTWSFDAGIAEKFDYIARREIPDYEHILALCIDFARTNHPHYGARIIDIGSATGYTLELLHNAGFTHIYGVDNSIHMIERSRVQKNLIHSSVFPKEHGPFELAFANWTLHFIDERENYMRDIYDSLTNQGVLILTDKMTSDSATHERYHEFKRQNGVTQEEINRKAAAIEGVLTTKPVEWYVETLQGIGFRQVDIVHTNLGFATLISRK
jgi:trans-aconitate methyltransferase